MEATKDLYTNVFRAIVRKKKENPEVDWETISQEVAQEFEVSVDLKEMKDINSFIEETDRLYQKFSEQKREGTSREVFFANEFDRIAEGKGWNEEQKEIALNKIKEVKPSEE